VRAAVDPCHGNANLAFASNDAAFPHDGWQLHLRAFNQRASIRGLKWYQPSFARRKPSRQQRYCSREFGGETGEPFTGYNGESQAGTLVAGRNGAAIPSPRHGRLDANAVAAVSAGNIAGRGPARSPSTDAKKRRESQWTRSNRPGPRSRHRRLPSESAAVLAAFPPGCHRAGLDTIQPYIIFGLGRNAARRIQSWGGSMHGVFRLGGRLRQDVRWQWEGTVRRVGHIPWANAGVWHDFRS